MTICKFCGVLIPKGTYNYKNTERIFCSKTCTKYQWKLDNQEKLKVSRALYKVRRKKRLVNFDIELTTFITEEAHHLRGLRDVLTGITWHVDHIIPLHAKDVSGLHVWNNLQVIPAIENLRKNNRVNLQGLK